MTSVPWLSFLIWCAVFNYLALILACGGFVLAHDWLFRFHSRWFKLSITQFDAIAYLILGLYKLAIWFFLIIPALAICYVNR